MIADSFSVHSHQTQHMLPRPKVESKGWTKICVHLIPHITNWTASLLADGHVVCFRYDEQLGPTIAEL